jgi:transcriptional regulator with XRE-family HTH domain
VSRHPLTLAELVKDARRTAGLTQEALAARAGLSARLISDLERNVNHSPRSGTMGLLAAALSLSQEEREQFEAAATGDRAAFATDGHAPTGARGYSGRAPAWVDLPRLVGRSSEQALLQRHLQGEGPRLVVFAGEPGIGKTRLLQEAVTLASARGLSVLQGTVAALDKHSLGDPVVDALRRATQECSPMDLRRYLRGCTWLVRVLPELASAPIDPLPSATLPPEQETALTARAVMRFVSNIAGPAGTLLIVDNLHRADRDGLELLARLTQAVTNLPFRIIGAYRDSDSTDGALPALLSRLVHERLVRHVTLAGLSKQDATELLRDLVSHERKPSTDRLDRIFNETGGVPFYLVASAESLKEHDADFTTGFVPWAIRQSVRDRVSSASPVVKSVLEALAVADGRATYPLLVALTGQPDVDVIDALESASRERLVDEDSHCFQFAYEVVRSVIAADLSHSRRLLIRKRLAALVKRDVRYVQGSTLPERVPHDSRHVTRQTRSASEERAYQLSVLRRRPGAESQPRTAPDGT